MLQPINLIIDIHTAHDLQTPKISYLFPVFTFEKIAVNDVEVHLMFYKDFPIDEHLHNLLPKELDKLATFSHPNRRREYVATRVLRTTQFGNDEILYNSIGAPYIEGEGYISISHSTNVVGLAFCKHHAVGLDLEPIREKVHRVKHKFLSEKEKASLDLDSTEEMIKVWSAKEALYKLAGRKEIIFAKQLLLHKIDNENWIGNIINPFLTRRVEMKILTHKDFVISVNAEAYFDYDN